MESGSTKTDWVYISDHGEEVRLSTVGMNPIFNEENELVQIIRTSNELVQLGDSVNKVYFYGAGCSLMKWKQRVEKALSSIFSNALVFVESDVLAAARATYSEKPGVTCILGTGSNSLYFDGINTRQAVPSLGFVLGDEASGAYFGKQLITDFLYKKLPVAMERDLTDNHVLTKELILSRVYQQDNANAFLASFMPVLLQYRDEKYVQVILEEGIMSFLEKHVLPYEGVHEMPIHFVGSISALLQSEIESCCARLNLTLGRVIAKPIDELIKYHLNGKN